MVSIVCKVGDRVWMVQRDSCAALNHLIHGNSLIIYLKNSATVFLSNTTRGQEVYPGSLPG